MSRLLRQQAPRFLRTACRLPETVLSAMARGMTVLSVMALSATMQFKIVRLATTLTANARL